MIHQISGVKYLKILSIGHQQAGWLFLHDPMIFKIPDHDNDSVRCVHLNGYNLFVASHRHMPGYTWAQIRRVHKNQQLHPLALDLNKIKILFSRISFQHGDPN